MGFLLTKKGFAVHRTPDSKIRKPKLLSCCCAVGTKNPVGLVATVFPEFIARDGQEPTNVGSQGEKRQVGAARRQARARRPEAGKPGRRRQGCARLAKPVPSGMSGSEPGAARSASAETLTTVQLLDAV